MMVYQDKYTWSHRLGDHCIAHHDGAVSLMLSWDGVDFELADDSGCNLIIGPLLSFLHNLDHRFFYEVHGWRDADSTSVDDYLSLNDKHIRGGDIAKHMRQSLADHVRPIARTNDTALVVTIPPFKSPLGFLSSSKRLLINQSKNAAKLLEQAKTIISFLSGAQLLSNVAYEQYILRSSNRDLFLYGNFKPDPTVFLNHQLASKPEIKDGFLYRDGLYHAVLFMPFYPDARPGWILNYSTYPIDMHISQTIRPLHHETARKQSQTSERLSGEGTTSNDKEGASKKASQERFFRQQMTDHNYNSISNCYCIHIHNESLEKVKHYTFLIKKNIQENGGNVDTSTLAQSCYYRISQPGQGYKSPFLRKDLSIQVAGMMPAQVFSLGDTNGEQLRLGLYGQPIRLTYKKDGVNHSLSSAKTGSGKDVEKQATLWETYPLGTNWLGIEIGNSYEWSVNSLNKDSSSYHIIDPEHTVINPFPLYSESNAFSDSPLDSHITEGTIRALSFILLDDPNVGKIDFQMAQIDQAAAETTLQMLYAVPKPDQPAPIFEDYYNMLSRPDVLDGKPKQQDAAKRMADNLGAFLDTAEGRLFNQQSNVIFNPELCFFDLKPVVEMPRLFRYYLLFLGIRFSQMLYASPDTVRFLLNEFSVMVKIAPDVVGGLMDAISRMGRKEGKSLDLVTQENEEMERVSPAILNSLGHHVLLYREAQWSDIGSRLALPQTVIDTWEHFPHPETIPFRNAFRSMTGSFYNLMLTFPKVFLDMSSTTNTDLKYKKLINKLSLDPFERLRLLDEFRLGKQGRGSNNEQIDSNIAEKV